MECHTYRWATCAHSCTQFGWRIGAAAVSSQFGGLGRLGQIELQKLFDHADFDEEALQQRLDINGDGVITKHEFLCALNERLAIFSLVRSRGAPRTTYSTSHLKHPYYSPFHPSF